MGSFFGSQKFNAAEVEPATGFEPLPEGDYTCMVDKAEEKPCKNDGVQLVISLRVIDGKYQKRTLFARINLHNKNPKCVELGRAELSAFCRATGIMTPNAAHEFANRTLKIHVIVARRQDNGQLSNEVKGFKPVGSAVAGLVQEGTSSPSQPSQQHQQPASQPAAASSSKAPWLRA